MCVCVLTAGTSVYHMHAWCPRRPEKVVGSPGAEIKGSLRAAPC